ncbi:estradiol 17-beta-dehydrogenase 11-like isoform X2 [Vespa mandarinia]|nr:estradiol 17-beta-dehydrogenase 11-like isoform X2 [Vespa mandarinia]XP_035737892.1 estradiol 17-beta-dehydrogenase 11-like isoform X2 [Vespa mandarinia]XP_035737893.1 estradiol 17-beta-dehydrogenase 11-like isoform X2 [Vespa mandarinia]
MWIFLPVLKFIISKFIGIMRSIMKLFIPLKYQMKDISGEIALVTGAAGGLGRAIAIGLANHGVIVVIWDINQNGIEETMELIKAAGGTCYGYVCDVRIRDDIYKTAEIVREEVGQVNILVNNAGVINIGNFLDIPDNLLNRTMEINIMSQFWTVKSFLPAMIKSNKGHIVSIASAAGHMGCPKLVDYCTSKHAVAGFIESLRLELEYEGYNINTTIISPYIIRNTGMNIGRIARFASSLSPNEVAEKTIISLRCNKYIVIIPAFLKVLIILKWILWDFFRMLIPSLINYNTLSSYEPIKESSVKQSPIRSKIVERNINN